MQDKKVTNSWPKAKNEKVIAQRLTWCMTEVTTVNQKQVSVEKERGVLMKEM